MGSRNLTVLFPSQRGNYAKLVVCEDWKDEAAELLDPPDCGGQGTETMERGGRKQPPEKLQSLNAGISVERRGESKVQTKNKHAAGTLLGLLLVAFLSLTLGLLLGQMFHGRTIYSSREPLYNWGDTVLVDGKTQSVTGYLASKMTAADIKENLRCDFNFSSNLRSFAC